MTKKLRRLFAHVVVLCVVAMHGLNEDQTMNEFLEFPERAVQDVNDILSRLDGVQRTPNGWSAKCPAHDDEHPSLTVAVRGNRILMRCHSAGCSIEDICEAIDIEVSDLFLPRTGDNKVNVEQLADLKGLPVDTLLDYGVEERNGHVRIPYVDRDGNPARSRCRNRQRVWWDTSESDLAVVA